MVDIHSHFLWGLDDGAQTQEESLAMLQMAAETGTTDIVATPHSDRQYRYDSEAVDKRIAELSSIRCGVPRLHLNYAHDQRFERCRTRLMPPVAEQLS